MYIIAHRPVEPAGITGKWLLGPEGKFPFTGNPVSQELRGVDFSPNKIYGLWSMHQKTAKKLLSWKKAAVVLFCILATVLYRTYQSYELKGHLDSVDIWGAALAMVMLSGVVGLVVWWGNREE